MTLHAEVAPGFEPVLEAFRALHDEGMELGSAFAVEIGGRRVVDLAGGWRDRERTLPWTPDTLVPVYSTTKPIGVLVLAGLVGRGLVDLEAPVAALWPEFGAHGKDRVTIAQALAHQAGVPGFAEPIDPALWLDPPALARALAALEPMWEPGTASGYHPLTHGYIVGELARRADGRTLGTILREDWCGPAGIDFHIGTPDALADRIARIERPKALPNLGEMSPPRVAAFATRWAAPDRGGAEWRRAEIPSANGHCTARAVASLYAVWANGGRLAGRDMISSAVLDAFSRERWQGEDLVLPFRLSWAAGILRNRAGGYGPGPRTLGHSGWGGSFGLADPDRGLSAGYVMNRQSNALMGDPRARRLVAALYACLD